MNNILKELLKENNYNSNTKPFEYLSKLALPYLIRYKELEELINDLEYEYKSKKKLDRLIKEREYIDNKFFDIIAPSIVKRDRKLYLYGEIPINPDEMFDWIMGWFDPALGNDPKDDIKSHKHWRKILTKGNIDVPEWMKK